MLVYLRTIIFTTLFDDSLLKTDASNYDPDGLFYISSSEETTNFLDAMATCYRLALQPSSINSFEEEQELMKTVVNIDTNSTDFWIGATSLKDRGRKVFSWYSSGEALSYSNLVIRQPIPDHDCVKFHYERPANATWQTEDCFESLRFVCKTYYNSSGIATDGFSFLGGKNIGDRFKDLTEEIGEQITNFEPSNVVSGVKDAFNKVKNDIEKCFATAFAFNKEETQHIVDVTPPTG